MYSASVTCAYRSREPYVCHTNKYVGVCVCTCSMGSHGNCACLLVRECGTHACISLHKRSIRTSLDGKEWRKYDAAPTASTAAAVAFENIICSLPHSNISICSRSVYCLQFSHMCRCVVFVYAKLRALTTTPPQFPTNNSRFTTATAHTNARNINTAARATHANMCAH